MRSIFDYMLSETSMDVFMWIKLDDIYQKLFYVKCEMDYRRRFGEVLAGKEEMPRIWKIIYADLFFYIIYALLILPFLLGLNDSNIASETQFPLVEFAVGKIRMDFESVKYRNGNINLYDVNSENRVTVDNSGTESHDQQILFPNVGDSSWNPPVPIAFNIQRGMMDVNETKKLIIDLTIKYKTCIGDDDRGALATASPGLDSRIIGYVDDTKPRSRELRR